MGQVQGTYTYLTPYYSEVGAGNQPGSNVFERFPLQAWLTDPHTYVVQRNDFEQTTIASNTIGGFTFTNVTSGTITQDTTNPNGVLLIDSGATTVNQGVNWQANVSAFKIAANKPVAFEVVGKFTGLTSLKVQTFIGLAATSTAIIASGAMAAIDRVGFQGITTTGVLNSVTRGGGTAQTGTGVTLVNNTSYRFGFFAASGQVDFYINGQIVSSLTTQIPTGVLAPSIVVMSNATVQPVFALDSLFVAGYRQ